MLELCKLEKRKEVKDRLIFKLAQFNIDENYLTRVIDQGNFCEEGYENKALVGALFCTQENAQDFAGCDINFTEYKTIDDILGFVSTKKELEGDDGAYVLSGLEGNDEDCVWDRLNISQKLKMKPEILLCRRYPDMESREFEEHVKRRVSTDFTYVKGGANPGTKTDALIVTAEIGENGNSYMIKQTPYNNTGVGKVTKAGKGGLEMEIYLKSGQEVGKDFYVNEDDNVVVILKTYAWDESAGRIKLTGKYLVKPGDISKNVLDGDAVPLYDYKKEVDRHYYKQKEQQKAKPSKLEKLAAVA